MTHREVAPPRREGLLGLREARLPRFEFAPFLEEARAVRRHAPRDAQEQRLGAVRRRHRRASFVPRQRRRLRAADGREASSAYEDAERSRARGKAAAARTTPRPHAARGGARGHASTAPWPTRRTRLEPEKEGSGAPRARGKELLVHASPTQEARPVAAADRTPRRRVLHPTPWRRATAEGAARGHRVRIIAGRSSGQRKRRLSLPGKFFCQTARAGGHNSRFLGVVVVVVVSRRRAPPGRSSPGRGTSGRPSLGRARRSRLARGRRSSGPGCPYRRR